MSGVEKGDVRITVSKGDVIWNYVGTILSMTSGFILLPLLMLFLSADELGLWYVFIAIANLSQLFEFGFNPTFARNIVYVMSGARRLSSAGLDESSVSDGIDWHLLNVVIKSCKTIYALLSAVVFAGLVVLGSFYIHFVTNGMNLFSVWVSWAIFCVAIVLSLYFLYTETILRGYGDVAGENKARTFSKLAQLAISAVLLLLNMGLVGASIGYLVGGLSLRFFGARQIMAHREIEEGRKSDRLPIEPSEVRETIRTISDIAWKDGMVQVSAYAATQMMSLIGSVTLGLAETGSYSVLMQFANAIANFACSYPKTFFPSFQSAYACQDFARMRKIVADGLVSLWFVSLVSTLGVTMIVLPLLPIIKPGFIPNYPLFLLLTLYLVLWSQHSIFCSFIIGMNEIPYMRAFIISAMVGVAMSYAFAGPLGYGAFGLAIGQSLAQLAYNNWKWPVYLSRKIGTTYRALWLEGTRDWLNRLPRGEA